MRGALSISFQEGDTDITTTTSPRVDVYTRVTGRIIEDLERGVLPWLRPWNAEHAAGRITRPLRFNGERYNGINILQLWYAAETSGYACPIWMTFQQASQLGGHVKKGKHGTPVEFTIKGITVFSVILTHRTCIIPLGTTLLFA